jgi:hypothetical protein
MLLLRCLFARKSTTRLQPCQAGPGKSVFAWKASGSTAARCCCRSRLSVEDSIFQVGKGVKGVIGESARHMGGARLSPPGRWSLGLWGGGCWWRSLPAPTRNISQLIPNLKQIWFEIHNNFIVHKKPPPKRAAAPNRIRVEREPLVTRCDGVFRCRHTLRGFCSSFRAGNTIN